MSFITFRNFLLVLYQAPAGYQGWQGRQVALDTGKAAVGSAAAQINHLLK